MVERQREIRAGAACEGVFAIRAGDHLRPLLDRTDPENGGSGYGNDRRSHQRPEYAGVRDGERRVLHFLGLEPLRASAAGKVVQLAGEPDERELVRALDDGNDQAPVERDRDAEVVLFAVDDAAAGDRSVEYRVLLERGRDRGQDERQERELLTGLLLELRTHLRADARDAGEIDLEERRDMRVRAPR